MVDVSDPHFFDKQFCQVMGYRYIRRNEFAPDTKEALAMQIRGAIPSADLGNVEEKCNCVLTKKGIKCNGKKCSLRSRMIECNNACGKGCKNQWISAFNSTCLQFQSNFPHGIVVAPKKAIRKGSFIVEYTGIVETGPISAMQPFAYPLSRWDVDVPMFVNCRTAGNEARMIVHSKTPNCVINPWVAGREMRLMVSAIKQINQGEKLTAFFPQMRIEPLSIVAS